MPVRKTCVHVWRVVWSKAPDRAAAALALLSPDEKARGQNFRFADDAAAYMQTRAALRRLLSWYADIAPETLTFAYSANGKPVLAGTHADLRFNSSHAEGQALIALCTGGEIGIDFEARKRNVNALDLAEAWFHDSEIETIRKTPPNERLAEFLRCWTRKEAVLKALGTGLSEALDAFAVPTGPCVRSRTVHVPASGHPVATVSSLDLGDDYIGAVAVCGATELSVEYLNFDPQLERRRLALPQTWGAAA